MPKARARTENVKGGSGNPDGGKPVFKKFRKPDITKGRIGQISGAILLVFLISKRLEKNFHSIVEI